MHLTHDHPDPRPTLLSVCAGIGGLDLAIERVFGARAVGYVKRDAYAQAVLLARMDEAALGCAPVWADLRAFPGERFRGVVDILAGGIPCQPHSVAGKQRRGEDERDLIDAFLDLARTVEPGVVIVENVRGFLARAGLGRLLGGLADLGFDAEWVCVRASEVGAPHRRERVFVLAHAGRGGQQRRRGQRIFRGAQGQAEGEGHQRERGGNATGASGEVLGHTLGARLEVGLPGAVARSCPAAWPPGPSGDWSDVPGWVWPALPQPDVRGVADGLPPGLEHDPMKDRIDRLRCLGNAVVPQQAELALRLLLNRARCTSNS